MASHRGIKPQGGALLLKLGRAQWAPFHCFEITLSPTITGFGLWPRRRLIWAMGEGSGIPFRRQVMKHERIAGSGSVYPRQLPCVNSLMTNSEHAWL